MRLEEQRGRDVSQMGVKGHGNGYVDCVWWAVSHIL
jgi:hypothetical protein